MVSFDRGTAPPPPAIQKKQLLSSAVKRTSEWVFSQEIPSDIAIQVGAAIFSLHKFPMVSRCGLIKKLLSETDSDSPLIEIKGIPGGAEAFELVVKFCYGSDFDITTNNLATLRCASEYLVMTEDYSTGNLASRTEAYLEEVALTSLSGAVTVLRESEQLLPMAERVGLVSRCIDAIARIACSECEVGLEPRAIVSWCAEELAVLRIDTFRRTIMAMKARGFRHYELGPVIMLYAQKSLRGLDIFGSNRNQLEPKQEHEKRVVLETIVGLLPAEKNAMPVSFLSTLLRAALYLESTVACRLDLEKRIASQLDQAVLDDLLIPSFVSDADTTFDVDTVRRILTNYLDVEDDEYASTRSTDVEAVGRLMEGYLAEIASDRTLTVARFVGLAEMIPEQAKVTDDGMYRGIDIYLKAHPSLTDADRKKVCSLMNCQNLSREACAHAAQNDRLPVQTVVQVLYYEQQRIQSSRSGSFGRAESPDFSRKVGEEVDDAKSGEIARLRRENDGLRLEVVRLRMQLKESIAKSSANSNSNSNSKPNSSGKPPLPPKKTNIINSVTKKLGRLYPFVQSDTLKSLPATARTKPPKDRRHSIS